MTLSSEAVLFKAIMTLPWIVGAGVSVYRQSVSPGSVITGGDGALPNMVVVGVNTLVAAISVNVWLGEFKNHKNFV